jgi:hypothetical protein
MDKLTAVNHKNICNNLLYNILQHVSAGNVKYLEKRHHTHHNKIF